MNKGKNVKNVFNSNNDIYFFLTRYFINLFIFDI